jgi:hypothetical protein
MRGFDGRSEQRRQREDATSDCDRERSTNG